MCNPPALDAQVTSGGLSFTSLFHSTPRADRGNRHRLGNADPLGRQFIVARILGRQHGVRAREQQAGRDLRLRDEQGGRAPRQKQPA